MATQSVPFQGAHGRHGSNGSNTMPYPPLTGSPTLTNPDMILPDYDRSDSPDDQLESPLAAWKLASNSNLDFHLPRQGGFTNSQALAPTTPIIYGNGTMLSDIGEVTEVESTVGPDGRRVSSRFSMRSDDDVGLAPAATIIQGQALKRASTRERRASIDSTSTITTQDQGGHFIDIDDSASCDDSNFQGDDEESMASSFAPDAYQGNVAARGSSGQYSTNTISQRAELILANAKRRLTTMEGNLTKARTYSPMSDNSTPSPPMVRPATAFREKTQSFSPVHSRDSSDSSALGPKLKPQRSASALGAAGGYRQPGGQSRSTEDLDGRTGRSKNKISQHPLDIQLHPLSEDEADAAQVAEGNRDSMQYGGLVSPAFSVYSDASLSRSSSVLQVRDIQDQVNGLKGKITSLKEQARADSIKRRSLQSLRTPSPFTHARWDQGYMEPKNAGISGQEGQPEDEVVEDEQQPVAQEDSISSGTSKEQRNGVSSDGQRSLARSASEKTSSGPKTPEQTVQESTARSTPTRSVASVSEEGDRQVYMSEAGSDDAQTWNGDIADEQRAEHQQYEDSRSEASSIEDYQSDGGESLYHDSFQNAVSHEDREDAFDYEHFFLHSAMGSMSRRREGSSDESVASDDSVETTRGPLSASRTSIRSVSTVDSFATATEGLRTRSTTAQGDNLEDEDDISPLDQAAVPEPPQTERMSYGFGYEDFGETRQRQNSVLHRPMNSSTTSASTMHRPSVSSFDSTGTNRSFPLVNKAKVNGGVLTPGASPDLDLKRISESLMDETGSVIGADEFKSELQPQGMASLADEDRDLVEGLIGSLGRCVMNLGEVATAGSEAQVYRRRIEAARRILEGQGY